MKKYSQNQEDLHILEYFKDKKGTVLDIGANDGKTFSNSLALIELGWQAILVEPSPVCVEKMIELHEKNQAAVAVCRAAIGKATGKAIFHESGYLNDPGLEGDNVSLVSTLIPEEKKRWEPLHMQWKEYEVDVLSWADFRKLFPGKFDFISIDAEGVDLDILKQIDLNETGTSLVCLEFNLNQEVKKEMMEYCAQFGLDKLLYTTGENIILGR